MPLGLACPTIPVFAWEFDSIPTETWFGEPFQDWRYVLKKTGRAITHSKFAVGAVRAAMGEAVKFVGPRLGEDLNAPVAEFVVLRRKRILVNANLTNLRRL